MRVSSPDPRTAGTKPGAWHGSLDATWAHSGEAGSQKRRSGANRRAAAQVVTTYDVLAPPPDRNPEAVG